MKQKNFVVEILEGSGKRTFIVRELSLIPNAPAVVCFVTDNPKELASFFGSSELFPPVQED